MLVRARQKVSENPTIGSVAFHKADIRRIDLGREFDAVLMMFAVLGYQLEDGDVLSGLETARRHLRQDGLLIFDVWYGPAMLSQGDSKRNKRIPTSEGETIRLSSSELDKARHLSTVLFQVTRLRGEEAVEKSEEKHQMRYFFRDELNQFLESSGFVPVRLGAFPEFPEEGDEATWNVLQVGQAV